MHWLARLALPMTAALAVTAAVPSSAPRPSISAADVSVLEGDVAIITLNLSEPAPDFILVEYRTGGRSAKGGFDYVESASFTQFFLGQTVTSISVVTLDDTDIEGDEVFVIHLRARGASAGGGPVKVTITDND